jgi:hypothetical protein
MPAYPGFVAATGRLLGLIADCSRLVNFLPREADGDRGRPALYSWPGQTAFATDADIVAGARRSR